MKLKKLIYLNEEKNRVIGIAAHDLKNPVGAIHAFAAMLRTRLGTSPDPKMDEGLQIILNLSSNTLHILANLLDVSAIESGKVELKKQLLDYADFLKHQVQYNQILADAKRIQIHLLLPEEPLIFAFDPQYLGEVVDNLLSNAVKYSAPGTKITVRAFPHPTGCVLTEVADQGKGIPAHEQQQIFQYL